MLNYAGIGDLPAGRQAWLRSLSLRAPLETWLSGRKRLTANEVGSKSPPGFESLRLRNDRQGQLGRCPSRMSARDSRDSKAGAQRREAGSCAISAEIDA